MNAQSEIGRGPDERENIIVFDDVSLSYGQGDVLRHFSLTVKAGEILAVVGNSGSGKTTALKLINGLLRANSGRVWVKGRDVSAMRENEIIELRRHTGYVIQGIGLLPHLSVLKNILYVPTLMHMEKQAAQQRALTLMELVGLQRELLRRHPRELSGGQRQRVGLARALAADPDILLMDEPFGAVDEIARASLQDALLDIHSKLKKTIFFITHDIDEALKLGTRILVMLDGVSEQLGTSDELLNAPATDYVRLLLGNRIRV